MENIIRIIDIYGPIIRTINGGSLKINELLPSSIALDGAVQGPVMGDEEDRWSFDHHAGCARLITQATCEQVFTALMLGFDTKERQIYINDIDGDTLVSLWLLEQDYDRLVNVYLRRLVHAVGIIDAHGPAGVHLLDTDEEAMSNAFFSRLREVLPRDVQSEYDSWSSFIIKGFEVIESVISDASNGRLKQDDWEDDEDDIEWLFHGERHGVEAIIARADDFGWFAALYEAGFRVVVMVSDAADGSLRYTIGKLSDLVSYPLGPGNDANSLLGRLNAREPGWGGGSSIGGSPRLEGGVSSRLTPEEIWKMMD
jgi:hypothetical protein